MGGGWQYLPFGRASAVLPTDGNYYFKLRNNNTESATVPVTLSLLLPDHKQTTDGALLFGKAVSAYSVGNKMDSWVFSAKAGQKVIIDFDGLNEVKIQTKSGKFLGVAQGFQFATTPYEIDIQTDETIEIVISGSIDPEIYTLKVSLVGQGNGTSVSSTSVSSSAFSSTTEPTITPTLSETAPPSALAISACPSSPTPRLSIGGKGRVTPGDANWLNSAPMKPSLHPGESKRIVQIPAGGVFDVLDGPQCADGITWWKVKYRGYTGIWTI